MNEKILLVGDSMSQVDIYGRLKSSIQKQMETLILDAFTGGSTPTGSAWDETLTERSLLESIREVEKTISAPASFYHPRSPIIENDLLTVNKQIKWPRCNKKKWAKVKRWAKNPKNFREVPDPNIYCTKNFITCHPSIAAEIKKTLGAKS